MKTLQMQIKKTQLKKTLQKAITAMDELQTRRGRYQRNISTEAVRGRLMKKFQIETGVDFSQIKCCYY